MRGALVNFDTSHNIIRSLLISCFIRWAYINSISYSRESRLRNSHITLLNFLTNPYRNFFLCLKALHKYLFYSTNSWWNR